MYDVLGLLSTNQALMAVVSSLSKKLVERDRLLAEATEALKLANVCIDRLGAQLLDETDRANCNAYMHDQANQSIHELCATLEMRDAEIEDLRKQISVLRHENVDAVERAYRNGRALDESDERIDALTEENDALREELDNRNSEIASSRRAYELMESNRDLWRAEFADLETRYSKLLTQMNTMIQAAMAAERQD